MLIVGRVINGFCVGICSAGRLGAQPVEGRAVRGVDAELRPGRAARSRSAPSTGPPTAADAVTPARSADAVDAEPVAASPARSRAGPAISSPTRAAAAPPRQDHIA